ncbi:hypothetical protein CBS470a_001575 [Colletotrichum nupharicola]|nr:hypothetical protein CBS470a_001575 [Colletotrichum nupharicola]
MGFLNSLRLRARRALRSRALRNLVLLLAAYTLLDALRVQRIITGATPPREAIAKRPRKTQKVYIAGMHYNDGALIKEHWNAAAEDVLALLDTNGGLYAAACSLDFSEPPSYYDTFALRDSAGQAHLMQTWPYFRSAASRAAMMAYADAVPVRSCWNGIVAMPAAPFLASEASGRRLRFRAVADSLAEEKHLEGSECCLIHVDNPLTEHLGVWLNPRVRVGYDGDAYRWANPTEGSWVSVWRVIVGKWEGRLRRLLTSDGVKEWVVRKRVREWEAEGEGRTEKGVDCLINEGQVLVYNGWAHV